MSNCRLKVADLALLSSAIVSISGCENSAAPVASDFGRTTPSAMTSRFAGDSPNSEGTYIVVLRSGTRDANAAANSLLSKTHGKMGHKFSARFSAFTAELTADDASRLASDPLVSYVEKNHRVTAQGGKPSSSSVTQAKAPWGLDRIDQENIPLDGRFTYSSSGAGVHIYIVDGGVRITHREFEGRATADFSAIDDGYGALGCDPHGTEVASLAAGKTFGVAKKALIHSVRVLDCSGGGDMTDVLAGIDWVINNGPLLSISASRGHLQPHSPTYSTAR
jgi:subtilisin family serine protease